MILIDLSQIMVASTMMSMGKEQSEVDIDMVRHMILNSLRMYRSKYHEEYGELVLCCDGRHSWRREHFPQYKAARKTNRDADNRDWSQIFGCLDTIKSELKEFFPYKYIQIDEAEADDIIGVLSREAGIEKVMIISGDKDFIQLQSNPNVKQYSIIQKKYLNGINPDTYLKEHIIKGDRGDGIPNILSDDDTFVSEKRQNKLQKIKIESWIQMDPQEFCNDRMYRNYCRNEQLVSLHKTPSDIIDKIVDLYKNYKDNGRSKLFNYFVKHKLKNLMEHIQEF